MGSRQQQKIKLYAAAALRRALLVVLFGIVCVLPREQN